MSNVDETGLNFNVEGMEPELSEEQRNLRDRFCEEYLVDYDALSAAMRVGFSMAYAKGYAEKFMGESYVRRRIALLEAEKSVDERGEEAASKRRIRAMLFKEANNYGPGSSHSARVSALSRLMSLYDMESPIKTKNEHLHRGGVMRVPAEPSLEDWENAALQAQQKLASDVRH